MLTAKRTSGRGLLVGISLLAFCGVLYSGGASQAGVVAFSDPKTYARNVDVLYAYAPHVLASLSSQLFEYKNGSVKPVFEYFLDPATCSFDGLPIPDEVFFQADHPVLSAAWKVVAEKNPKKREDAARSGTVPETFDFDLDPKADEAAPLSSLYKKADGRLLMTSVDWIRDNVLSRRFVLNIEGSEATGPHPVKNFDSYLTRYPDEIERTPPEGPDGIVFVVAEKLAERFWSVTWLLVGVGLVCVVVTRRVILAAYKRSRPRKRRHRRSSSRSRQGAREGGNLQLGVRAAGSGFPGEAGGAARVASPASAPRSGGAAPDPASGESPVVPERKAGEASGETAAGEPAAPPGLPREEEYPAFPRVVRRPYHAIRCRLPG